MRRMYLLGISVVLAALLGLPACIPAGGGMMNGQGSTMGSGGQMGSGGMMGSSMMGPGMMGVGVQAILTQNKSPLMMPSRQ